ncbi:hypothetical protein [Congregibacter sp.]|uniref:hypothetical protein n=1 Tax=Congregibacter sp. TaxID=2744308 RepID=UPI003F6C3727
MSKKPLRTAGKKKPPAAVETSSSLEDKVKAFLEAGGEIEQIKSGVSGQANMAAPKAKSSASKSAN